MNFFISTVAFSLSEFVNLIELRFKKHPVSSRPSTFWTLCISLYQIFLCLRKRRLRVQLGNIQDSARKAQQNHTNEQSGNIDPIGNYAKWQSFKCISRLCIFLPKIWIPKKSSKLKSKGKTRRKLNTFI